MNNIDHALAYAAKNKPIFPLVPGAKVPVKGSHGFKDATTSEAVIRVWWDERPGANIGMPTGAASELIVIDEDPRNDGDAGALNLPPTLTAWTPRGGRHFYFQHPGGKVPCDTTGKLGPGIDVKGDGGQVVLPPSSLASGGSYQWEDPNMPIAELPAHLLAILIAKPDPSSRNGAHPAGGDPIPEGQRNAALTSLGGSMRRRGMTKEEIEAALFAVNAARCVPPLPEEEVEQIAASVSRYAPAADPKPDMRQQRHDQRHDQERKEAGGEGSEQRQAKQEQQQHQQRQRTGASGFDWRSRDQTASALRGKHIVSKPYVVPDFLPHGYDILGGRPKEGKTTFAMQIGGAVASETGLVLGGRIPQHGTVGYFCLEENEVRMQKRLGQMFGPDAPWPERLHLFYQWPDMQRGGLEAMSDFHREYQDLALVIIDPFALFRGRANIHASYELDYQDSARLGQWVNEHGVSLLLITHTHQEAGEEPINLIQGTTGIVGPADNVLVMVRQQGVMTLLRKGRDFEDDTPVRLKGDLATLLWTPDSTLAPKPARESALEALSRMQEVWAAPRALADYAGVTPDAMRQALHRLIGETPPLVLVNSANRYALARRVREEEEGGKSA